MTLLFMMNLGFAWGPVTPPTPPYTFGHRTGPIDQGAAPGRHGPIDQGAAPGRHGPIVHVAPKRTM